MVIYALICLLSVLVPSQVYSISQGVSVESEAIQSEADGISDRLTNCKERIRLIESRTETKTAKVSFYHDLFHGRVTASGIRFDQEQRQIAHKTLPFGTTILLTSTKWSSWGVVTDRGPYIDGREFDVSRLIARELGMERQGVIEAEILIIRQAP